MLSDKMPLICGHIFYWTHTHKTCKHNDSLNGTTRKKAYFANKHLQLQTNLSWSTYTIFALLTPPLQHDKNGMHSYT